ncbi:hypothetical protein [Bradyrhizobium sp. AUGA SZCCT0182]|nr:hypothetical protein [Bradyrhizobium sp. AUGA SZCCT0182]
MPVSEAVEDRPRQHGPCGGADGDGQGGGTPVVGLEQIALFP